MTIIWKKYWLLILLTAILLGIAALTLAPYNWNPSALFHIDRSISDAYPQPKGTVVLEMPGYDGMEYWQIARNVPLLFSPSRWEDISSLPPGAYAHQRMLLPVLAYGLALGQDELLPWSFLIINILSLIGTCALFAFKLPSPSLWRGAGGEGWYAIGLALCPAAMVALHFSVAEPLSLLLTTAFILRYLDRSRIDEMQLILLSLLVLTREINILFVGAILLFVLCKGRWKDALRLLIPIGVFFALHAFIYAVFHQIPFLWSADKKDLPLVAIFELLSGARGYNQYTLSSIGLFVLFVLPAFVVVCADLWRKRSLEFLPTMLLIFLGVMLAMPDHIWGSITSIGRVITPVYPLFFIYAATRDRWPHRLIALAVAILGVISAIGLALIVHPFTLA